MLRLTNMRVMPIGQYFARLNTTQCMEMRSRTQIFRSVRSWPLFDIHMIPLQLEFDIHMIHSKFVLPQIFLYLLCTAKKKMFEIEQMSKMSTI